MPALSFATLAPGQTFTSTARTTTETDLVLFTMLAGDWHPIHADAEHAKRTPLGQRMLHGTYGIAVAMGMAANLLELKETVVAALGLREWLYEKPLFVGQTIHVRAEVLATRTTSDGRRGVLDWRIELRSQDEVVRQVGTASLMVALAPASPDKEQPAGLQGVPS